MTFNEKMELLTDYSDRKVFTNISMITIIGLSDDKDILIRCKVAELLINFENIRAKNVLLKLAQDNNSLVRAEAYDSLSVFVSKEVESFLKNAILSERNEIACTYAIMSWADVAINLGNRILKRILLYKLKKISKIKRSERCMLSCYYAEYILGRKKV